MNEKKEFLKLLIEKTIELRLKDAVKEQIDRAFVLGFVIACVIIFGIQFIVYYFF